MQVQDARLERMQDQSQGIQTGHDRGYITTVVLIKKMHTSFARLEPTYLPESTVALRRRAHDAQVAARSQNQAARWRICV